MIYVVKLLIKLMAQLLVMPIIGFGLILMALIFLDDRYMYWGEEIQNTIWKK
jgi:hypothetical protein